MSNKREALLKGRGRIKGRIDRGVCSDLTSKRAHVCVEEAVVAFGSMRALGDEADSNFSL